MRSVCCFFGLCFVVVLCMSHELFLKTDSHSLKANTATELFLLNGTFDTSENATLVGGTIVIPHFRRAYEYWEELEKQEG